MKTRNPISNSLRSCLDAGLLLLTAILLGPTVQAQAADGLLLAENGQAKAVIVHNGLTRVASTLDASQVKPAVDDLRDYLKQITGANFPMVATLAEAGERPTIVLEVVDKLTGASDRVTAAQAYRITATGQRLTLTAASPLALHYAVYGLLEDHLGCRFYTFVAKGLQYGGRGYEIVPRQPKLVLSAIHDLQEPAFANRGFIFWMGSYPWSLQNRGLGTPGDRVSGGLGAGHNFYHLLPPDDRKEGAVVVPGLFKTHPEFYPMSREGKRQHDWSYGICGSNPELPTFLAKSLEGRIQQRIAQARNNGQEVEWSLPFEAAQGDGFTGCQCPECRKLVRAEQAESAPLILALNRTLELIGQQHPQAQVITFAYFVSGRKRLFSETAWDEKGLRWTQCGGISLRACSNRGFSPATATPLLSDLIFEFCFGGVRPPARGARRAIVRAVLAPAVPGR